MDSVKATPLTAKEVAEKATGFALMALAAAWKTEQTWPLLGTVGRVLAAVAAAIAVAHWLAASLTRAKAMAVATVRRTHEKRLRRLGQAREDNAWIVGLRTDQSAAAQRTMLHVNTIFRVVSLLFPKRLANEEIGDALEQIAEHFKRSPKRWPVYRTLVTTVLWILVNAIRYLSGK